MTPETHVIEPRFLSLDVRSAKVVGYNTMQGFVRAKQNRPGPSLRAGRAAFDPEVRSALAATAAPFVVRSCLAYMMVSAEGEMSLIRWRNATVLERKAALRTKRRTARSRLSDAMSKEDLHDTIKRLDATVQKLDGHIGELSEATNAQLEFLRISMATPETKLDSAASRSSVDGLRADIKAASKKLDRLVAGSK